jgi:ribosome biogenesis GTPase
MITPCIERLRRLGLTPTMAQHLEIHAANTADSLQLARVSIVHRESLGLHDGLTERSARLRPALLQQQLRGENSIAVGDWVLCACDEHVNLWVEALLPALTHIARRDADGRRHAVVSNVDTALLLMGLDLDYNVKRLERYLALVQGSGVTPVVVLTKADLQAGDPAADSLAQRQAELRERIGPDVAIVALDARAPCAVDRLAPYLGAGQTLVLLGSSGAGKSTLTNTLLGRSAQDTGPVREHDSRGKHTTTARSLHPLACGACIIDTPGVRTLRPDVDARTLGGLFADITALALECRFRDCEHLDEPGCAVRASLHPERLRNYHKLLREAGRDSMTVLQRQQQLAQWKARGRAGRQRAQQKKADW